MAMVEKIIIDFYRSVLKSGGWESDVWNNNNCSSSLTSFRLTAQYTESCDRYIVTEAARISIYARPSNDFSLRWAYYGHGCTEANNGVFHLAWQGGKPHTETFLVCKSAQS